MPYLLSNLDLVTESLTLMAGNSRTPSPASLVEPLDPVGGLLGHAADVRRHAGEPLPVPGQAGRERAEDRSRYSSGSSAVGCGTAPAASNSTPLWTSSVASPPSSTIMLGVSPPGNRNSWSVHHQYSSRVSPFQAKTDVPRGSLGRAVRPDHDRRRRLVLGGEDVAGDPAHLGAECDQGLDEDGRLDRHVQRAGDAGAGQRRLDRVLAADRHEAGHLVLGQPDLVPPVPGQGQVGHGELEPAVLLHRGVRCGVHAHSSWDGRRPSQHRAGGVTTPDADHRSAGK